MDVASAADPAAAGAAARRLTALVDDPGASHFGTLVSAPLDAAVNSQTPSTQPKMFSPVANVRSPSLSAHAAAYNQLEGFFLQTVISSMMPAQSETIFGKGTAGSVWKSMLAEQIAKQVAKSGGLGLLAPHNASSAPSASPLAMQNGGALS